MKAVNLIPPEEQRGGAGGAGRSGGAVYVLLGVLGALVLAVVVYVLTANAITDRKAEVTRVTNEAAAAQAQATALRPYRDFAQLRQKRVTTVAQLASNRFDWERTMRDLARVIPGNVWLTTLRATVSPSVQLGGSGGGAAAETGTIRGKQPVPAVEIVGCTTNQAEVARVLTRLRLIQDVSRVTLIESAKNESQVGASGGAASSGASAGGVSDQDCRHGSSKIPRFQLVVFFKPLPAATAGTGSAAAGAAGATAPAARSTPPASGSSPPASASSSSSPSGSSSAPGSSGSAGAAPGAQGTSGRSR